MAFTLEGEFLHMANMTNMQWKHETMTEINSAVADLKAQAERAVKETMALDAQNKANIAKNGQVAGQVAPK